MTTQANTCTEARHYWTKQRGSLCECEAHRRCCAHFSNGKRCSKRVSGEKGHDGLRSSWCAKHHGLMESHIAAVVKIIKKNS